MPAKQQGTTHGAVMVPGWVVKVVFPILSGLIAGIFAFLLKIYTDQSSIAIDIEGIKKDVARYASVAANNEDKIDNHLQEPAHDVAATELKNVKEDIAEIKQKLK